MSAEAGQLLHASSGNCQCKSFTKFSMGSSVHSNVHHVFHSTAALCVTASLPSCHSIHWIGFLATSDSMAGEMRCPQEHASSGNCQCKSGTKLMKEQNAR